jgi:hypothetical protein
MITSETTRTPDSVTRQEIVAPTDSIVDSPSNPASQAPKLVRYRNPSIPLPLMPTRCFQVQNRPLPHYSIHLPSIDRTKSTKDFYEDLQEKFIIAGCDEERFSCWCHVEKEKMGASAPLSLKHVAYPTKARSRVQRYKTYAFFAHAQHCAFFKVR